VVARGGVGWPSRLDHLETPPGLLWLEGSGRADAVSVAVVGARRATVAGVAALGITVISGLALGIDGAAHRGALDSGGETLAVLGCGLDIDYPRAHSGLRTRVREHGLLISEYDPGRTPEDFLFPRRNRIIAALALAVVVVEATERSGALSTARWAADLGREVLAVPGSIRAEQYRGSNLLIRDGARPYLGPQDLVDVLPELDMHLQAPSVAPAPGRLSASLRAVLDRLGADPVHPDAIAAVLGLGPAETAARISALELAGVVRSLPGGLILRAAG